MAGIKDIWLFSNNIIRSARHMVNEALKPLNLSSAEGNILLHLLTSDSGLRQDEIVEQLDISKPAVSRALDSLETKGYVTRTRNPNDRRVSRVGLTDKAFAIGSSIERVYNDVYSVATRVVSEREIEQFIGLFGRVSDSFSAARANTADDGRQRDDQ